MTPGLFCAVCQKACGSPVAPGGDAHGLDDEDYNLDEKHKEEEEEVEGAVSPKQTENKSHIKIT